MIAQGVLLCQSAGLWLAIGVLNTLLSGWLCGSAGLGSEGMHALWLIWFSVALWHSRGPVGLRFLYTTLVFSLLLTHTANILAADTRKPTRWYIFFCICLFLDYFPVHGLNYSTSLLVSQIHSATINLTVSQHESDGLMQDLIPILININHFHSAL